MDALLDSQRALSEIADADRHASLGDTIRAKDRFDGLRGGVRLAGETALRRLNRLGGSLSAE